MIEDIATHISNILNIATLPSVFDGLIGMEDHMREIEPLLRLNLEEVRMIGIWGPPGIGKSTIARCLFNQHSGKFSLGSIMVDIKGSYPRRCLDEGSTQLQLQSQMLSQLFNHKDKIVIHHLGVAQERLKDKKVFLVLDDVDRLAQLVALAKETRWFGPGSRIIITTEDLRVLKAHGINHIYKVDFPTNYQAFQMFCMYAFDQKYPKDGFKDLSWEVTELAGELPLGLKVMGSHFRGMSIQEWETALPKLRSSLHGEIENILRFSYDALSEDDKYLFLHIACLFNKRKTEKVVEHLKKTFTDARHRLDVLAEKSLIYMEHEHINMHALLEKLGRDIVRNKCVHDPGQRQFLVNSGEICEVLMDGEAGSRSVIGINYDKYFGDGVNLSEGKFKKMSNLQFLTLNGWAKTHYLSPQLRLLDWINFPMTCLPSNFDPNFLVELHMPNSKLVKLWEGIKLLPSLKWMDLSSSYNLKELPNLSTATKLQKLTLSQCSSLVEFPSSIGNATNLQELNLKGCSSLVELPSSIGNATNLQKLDLRYCSSLVELPSSIGNAITNLQKLDFCGCSSLAQIPSFIGNATHLTSLSFGRCSSLVEVPAFIGNLQKLSSLDLSRCTKLEVLPVNVNLKSLFELYLSGCSSLKSFPDISTNVSFLVLSETAIEEVPPLVKGFSRLRSLILNGCKELLSLRQLPDSLQYLNAQYCESLERIDLSFRIPGLLVIFDNCFKLNKEARDLIIQGSRRGITGLPGKQIPTYFTHRGNGGSLIVELDERPFPSSLIFRACILLAENEYCSPKRNFYCKYGIKNDEGQILWKFSCFKLHYPKTEHLYIFDFEEADVTRNEIFFEFWFKHDRWIVKECGVHIVNTRKRDAKKKKNEGDSVEDKKEENEGDNVDEEELNEGESVDEEEENAGESVDVEEEIGESVPS